ncbi:PilZ domain-containing protein [bacterium CPR1]|nr:PilZ domain-containing protein [bacterium CPR1]
MGINRRHQRVRECLPAWYRCDQSRFLRSSVLDVSEGGARLVATEALPEGEVHLTLRLEGVHVTVLARRAWQKRLSRGEGYLIGLRFDEPPGSVRRWVRRQVQLRELQRVAG